MPGVKRAFRILVLPVLLLCFAPCLTHASSFALVVEESLYPAPMADRNFPRFSLSFPIYLRQAIDTLQEDHVPSLREVLEFGGQKSLFRFDGGTENDMLAECSIGAGVVTLFDSFENNLENFGWEGSGFLTVDVGIGSSIAFRFGFHHLSSHVGDEYLARYDVVEFPADEGEDLEKGKTYGLDYVRDSLMGALSVKVSEFFRVYAEARYSMDMLRYMHRYNDHPWQASVGMEVRWPSLASQHKRWYVAIHAAAYQESSWYPSTTVQIGRVFTSHGTNERFRYGVEWYHGRAQIAAFNHHDGASAAPWSDLALEQYVAIGAWYDF